MKKIGFVFFDSLHIIHHFVGVAVEMSKQNNTEVNIITDDREHKYLFQLLKLLNAPENIVVKVSTYTHRKIIDKIKNRKKPSSKYLFEKNQKFLLNYDILVFNDANHEYLYNKRKDKTPKFVMLMHGAGDREYLIGDSFREKVSKFDLITTSGEKVNSFYKNMNLPNTKLEICGYQKFDLVKKENKNNKFFSNGKPIVLYNPHFEEGFSSWYKFGNDMLEFFYNNEEYNLIFAPHINLFNKKGYLNKDIINLKYFNRDNILIDLGSNNSVNMAYTMASDIYIGDVSSQVYEFLMIQKPCVFINSYNVEWENDKYYQNWKLGKVIPNILDLKRVLKSTNIWQADFLDKQKKAIEYTFYTSKNKTATQLVVSAIKSIY